MSDELKPCPYCGSIDLDAELPVSCLRCGAVGPSEAAAGRQGFGWNDRRGESLRWTAERPTVPGWYWVLGSAGAERSVMWLEDGPQSRFLAGRGCMFAGPLIPPPCPAPGEARQDGDTTVTER